MNFQVTISLNAEALSAINGLADAIRSIGGVSSNASTALTAAGTAAADLEAATDATETGPIYWADNSNDHFGKVDTEAEYKALKKKAAGTYKTTESIYNEKLAQLKAKNEADAQAKKDAAAAAKADKAAQAKKEAAATKSGKEAAPADIPSEDDLIAAFQAYLPKDLSKEERAERHAFVKPLLQRFGVQRATELAEEHRALAINLVERKMAGEDIDPASSEFAEVAPHGAAEDEDVI